VEGTLILASLLRDFDVSAVGAEAVRPKPRMTLQAANPVHVCIERRSETPAQ
jgi:cytochrome P450